MTPFKPFSTSSTLQKQQKGVKTISDLLKKTKPILSKKRNHAIFSAHDKLKHD
jgi:hypothetical protein